jgi:hypothetical protein
MPSLATRLAIAKLTLANTEAAADAAISAANAANTAAANANATIAEIESGTLDLDAVKVGGTRFVNSGGSLVAEP